MIQQLFTDTDTAPKSEREVIQQHRREIIAAIAKELARSEGFRDRARRKGKRSRSTLNLRAIGERFGLPWRGYSALDRIAGAAIWATLGADAQDATTAAVDSYLAKEGDA